MAVLGRRIAVLAMGSALGLGVGLEVGGCARAAHEITHSASWVLLPPEEETRLGHEVAAEFERGVELLDDPEIVAYVEGLGERIAAVADVPEGIELRFAVVDAPDVVNAVALPGGYIYVYTGLMQMAQDEAELVAVLAHEVAHVTRRHIASQLVAMFGIQTVTAMVLGDDPGMVQQLAAGVAAQGYMLQFGREAEREADEVGLRYVVEAGWDPHGYVSFFSRLSEYDVDIPVFLRSHPAPRERVANARRVIAELETVPDRAGRETYQQVRERLEQPRVARGEVSRTTPRTPRAPRN
jgi:beta-barrel assembly-enhancing protease